MTDKQIIIDGIDVSGCNCFITQMDFPNNLEGGYYNQNNLCECGIQGVESYPFFCKDNPNCNYKQLKRKEQECEELKDKLSCCFCNPYVELNNIEKQRKCVEVTKCFRRQIDQLKQTITEIKVLSENVFCLTNALNRDMALFAKQIIQKISECEATNER